MKIRPLNRKDQKQLLASVLCQLDGELPNGWWARLKREVYMLFFGVLAAVIVIIVAAEPSWTLVLLTGGALSVGFALGIFAWRVTAAAQWPVVAKCIDRAAVESQLRALGA